MLSKDLLSGAGAAANYLGVSRRAVYYLVEGGHVPTVRKGGRLYFRKSELERAFSSEAPVAANDAGASQ